MKNTMTDLRDHLFGVIGNLRGPEADRMDNKTATTVCLAAKRLIETAHVELRFREQVGADLMPSDFLGLRRLEGRRKGKLLESA